MQKKIFIYLFMTVLGPHHCGLFLAVQGRGLSQVVAMQCPLSLWSMDSRVCKLSSCGPWAQQLCLQGFRAQPNSSGLAAQ